MHMDKKGKVLKGVVVSDKMQGSIVVSVEQFKKHRVYGKYQKVTKRYTVHDPENSKKVGDKVSIKECRPISKTKSFAIVAQG